MFHPDPRRCTMDKTPSLLVLLLITVAGAPLQAQWIKHPTPGLPRSSDGSPNLTAPAPKTADGKSDLTGTWRLQVKRGSDLKKLIRAAGVQPWAQARFER